MYNSYMFIRFVLIYFQSRYNRILLVLIVPFRAGIKRFHITHYMQWLDETMDISYSIVNSAETENAEEVAKTLIIIRSCSAPQVMFFILFFIDIFINNIKKIKNMKITLRG
jgi:hypothetical protein